MALRYWKGTSTLGECKIANSVAGTQLSIDTTPDVVAVGRIALDPGFPFFARDMLVMTDGVYGYSGTFTNLYASLRPLAGAASADLDSDGQGDGVLIAADEDDVDVLFRRPNAVFDFLPGYVVYRVDTTSKVTQTRIADFDGNGKLDLAMVEHLDGYDQLSVGLRSRGLPAAARGRRDVRVGAVDDQRAVQQLRGSGGRDRRSARLAAAAAGPDRAVAESAVRHHRRYADPVLRSAQ